MNIMAKSGMVASQHYLATIAGVTILQRGGNAVDAAIATNAMLNVTYPAMCGLGGDAFWIIWDSSRRKLFALNGSGRAPYAATRDFFIRKGLTAIPEKGILPITVPGAVDSWNQALTRFGTMKLKEILSPAIRYAYDGFPISQKMAQWIKDQSPILENFPPAPDIYFTNGKFLQTGEILVQKALGKTLESIAEKGTDDFYKGKIGSKIATFAREKGGLLSKKDLEDHECDWVEPIATSYRDYAVYGFPPNSQGLTTLLELNIIEGFPLAKMKDDAEAVHLMVEAKKLAFADRDAYITDPEFMEVPLQKLLSKSYAAKRRSLIDAERTMGEVPHGRFNSGDTSYLCTVDKDGNAVSLIQSLFYHFGSGVMAGDTGVFLQNRGAYFSLNGEHPNSLEPHKRTMHTLSPLMILKKNNPYLVFGTMGGDGQPQTHLQVLTKIIDFDFSIQDAITAPRWLSGKFLGVKPNSALYVEDDMPSTVIDGLKKRGHDMRVVERGSDMMGHANGILINSKTGILSGAADPRSDGIALGY